MKLTITSPERQILKNYNVQFLKLTTQEKGQVTILEGHADYIASLDTGTVSFEGIEDKKQYLGVISTGFLKICNNQIDILANTMELAQEIDLDRVQKSKAKAEEMLKKINNPEELEKYNRKLNRALARLEVSSIGR